MTAESWLPARGRGWVFILLKGFEHPNLPEIPPAESEGLGELEDLILSHEHLQARPVFHIPSPHLAFLGWFVGWAEWERASWKEKKGQGSNLESLERSRTRKEGIRRQPCTADPPRHPFLGLGLA